MRKLTENIYYGIEALHCYNLDAANGEIYLMGEERIEHEGEEPGVEYTMANRFIRNLNFMDRYFKDKPIIVHMKTCFSRKTPILTNNGYVPIKDISVGDMVMTHTGEYKPVVDTMSKMYDGNMVRLYYGRHHHNTTSIASTDEHPVLIERNGTRQWIKIRDVKIDDIIFIDSSICKKTGEPTPWYKSVKNFNADRLRRKGNSPLTKKFEEKILIECDRLESDGWKVVPVDMGVRPDIIGIKNNKIVAFEVEESTGKSLEVKKEKYENASINEYIDDVVWITPNETEKSGYTWYEVDDETPFIKVKVTGTETWKNKYKQRVYDLTVQDNHSYIANHVVVHNCGGSWEEGMAIYDAIKNCSSRVVVVSYTHARSMSSIILQAADQRILMPNSSFMFHDGSYGTSGTWKRVKTEVDFYKKADDVMMKIYIDSLKHNGKFSKWGRERISEMLRSEMDCKEDVYLTANDAVEWGFADEIFDGDWNRLKK